MRRLCYLMNTNDFSQELISGNSLLVRRRWQAIRKSITLPWCFLLSQHPRCEFTISIIITARHVVHVHCSAGDVGVSSLRCTSLIGCCSQREQQRGMRTLHISVRCQSAILLVNPQTLNLIFDMERFKISRQFNFNLQTLNLFRAIVYRYQQVTTVRSRDSPTLRLIKKASVFISIIKIIK